MSYLTNLSIPSLLLSRKFWTLLVTFALNALVIQVPEFEAYVPQMIESMTFIGFAIAFLFGSEDVAVAWKTGERNSKYGSSENA